MDLNQKMVEIQTQLKAPKKLYNNFGKYAYRNAEEILEAFKPFEKIYDVYLILTDDIDSGGNDRFYVKATAKLVDAESGEYIESVAYAREPDDKKGMDASQITGAASSYARKYALNGLFLLDDSKDADSDEYRILTEGKKAVKTENTEELSKLKKDIIAKCTELGGTKNQALMTVLKNFVPTGNPNGIKEVSIAKECLEKIKSVKPLDNEEGEK